MSGKILQAARRDSQKYITKGGIEEDIIIETKDQVHRIALTGYATKHHINFDSDGLPVNTKNAHISIIENDLVKENYPVRNLKNEVALRGHLVSYKDSTGNLRDYIINEVIPDETFGIIVCILGDYKKR